MIQQSVAIRPTFARPSFGLGARGVAAVLVGAHIANDALTSMLSALLPTLQGRLALSDGTLALLVAALAFSASVTQPVLGALSDRFGARLVAAAGTAFGLSLLSLMAGAPSVATLFGLLLLGGLGSAAFHPAATSLLAATPLRRRELGIGLFSAGGTLGLAVGPLLVLAAAGSFGLSFTPWFIVPALGLGALMYALMPDVPTPDKAVRAPILDPVLLRGRVGGLAAAATLGSVAFVTFASAYPLYLVREHGLEPSDPWIGLTLAAFNLGAAGGAILAGALAPRVDRRLLAGASLGGSIVPLGLLLVVSPTGPLYVAIVASAGALLNASLPVLLVAVHRLAPDRTAAASGMLMGLPVGLAGLLYVVVGRLQDAVGLAPAMAVAFLAVLPAAVLVVAGLSGVPAGEGVTGTSHPAADEQRGGAPSLPHAE